jgi:hypothetical protein
MILGSRVEEMMVRLFAAWPPPECGKTDLRMYRSIHDCGCAAAQCGKALPGSALPLTLKLTGGYACN